MKKKILVSSVIIIVVAVALYFALFNKKEVETTAFGRTLGLSEKNALKDSIVAELWKVRQSWFNDSIKIKINPDSASKHLNEMSSDELLTIDEMVKVFNDSLGKSGNPSKKDEQTLQRFFAILEKYNVDQNNGLRLIQST